MKKNGIVNINSNELNNIDNIKHLIEQQKNPIDDYIFNDNFKDMLKILLIYYDEKNQY